MGGRAECIAVSGSDVYVLGYAYGFPSGSFTGSGAYMAEYDFGGDSDVDYSPHIWLNGERITLPFDLPLEFTSAAMVPH
jgi:hypothetical protein